MDTLDLSPGKAIGLFELGDTLWHVLDILRARKSEVPKLDIAWDPEVCPCSGALLMSERRQERRHRSCWVGSSALLTRITAPVPHPCTASDKRNYHL